MTISVIMRLICTTIDFYKSNFLPIYGKDLNTQMNYGPLSTMITPADRLMDSTGDYGGHIACVCTYGKS